MNFLFHLAVLAVLVLSGRALHQPVLLPDIDGERIDLRTSTPVYPRIARHPADPGYGEDDVEGNLLPNRPTVKTRVARLSIPGYLVYVGTTVLLAVVSVAFWCQLVYIWSVTGEGVWSQLLLPSLFTVSFLLSLLVLRKPGALVGSLLRFLPLLSLLLVSLLMAGRVLMMSFYPDHQRAVLNVSFVMDGAWLVCGAVLTFVTAWSWGLRTEGDSFLSPWLVKKDEPSVEVGGDVESPDGTGISEKKQSVFTSTIRMLSTMASLSTAVYLSIMLLFYSSGLSAFLVALSVPIIIVSFALTISSLTPTTSSKQPLMILMASAGLLAILLQALFPHLFGVGIPFSDSDRACLLAPLQDISKAVSGTPLFVTLSDVASEIAQLPVPQVPKEEGGVLGWLWQNVTAGRVGAAAVIVTVAVNVVLLIVGGPAGVAAGATSSGSAVVSIVQTVFSTVVTI